MRCVLLTLMEPAFGLLPFATFYFPLDGKLAGCRDLCKVSQVQRAAEKMGRASPQGGVQQEG